MNTHSGVTIFLSNCFCLSSETGSTLKGKNLGPNSFLVEQISSFFFFFFFLFFQKTTGVQESKQEVTKVLFVFFFACVEVL